MWNLREQKGWLASLAQGGQGSSPVLVNFRLDVGSLMFRSYKFYKLTQEYLADLVTFDDLSCRILLDVLCYVSLGDRCWTEKVYKEIVTEAKFELFQDGYDDDGVVYMGI